MLNERELTKKELEQREKVMKDLKTNKRSFVKRYGKDAEAVMYGRATNIAKKQAENMNKDKVREMIKSSLQGPVSEKKGKDMDGDGDIDSQDYLAARDAAIKKTKGEKVDEMDLNDPVAMRLRADKVKPKEPKAKKDVFYMRDELEKRRAQIMRDMEREAEPEGGPIADKYGAMLDKVDSMLAQISGKKEKEYKLMEEGFYGPGGVESITRALGYSDPYEFFEDNPGAVDAVLDWAETIPEFNEMLQDAEFLQEDMDLGHQDNEPHMLKADLYRIGKYAMELYQMVDRFEEGSEEVDFPHWWQAKVIKAKDMLVSAKHYLDFEIKEPQIDAMVDVAQDEDVVGEGIGNLIKKGLKGAITNVPLPKESLLKVVEIKIEKLMQDGGSTNMLKIAQLKGFLEDKIKDGTITTIKPINAMIAKATETPDGKSAFEKRLAKLAASEKAKREKNPKYGKNSKLGDVDFEDFFEKGQSYQEFKKRLDTLKEGVWSLGTADQIVKAIQSLEMLQGMDAASIADSLEDDNKFYYNVLGDDLVHDGLDRAERAAAMGDEDGALNGLSDAIGRAEDLLKHVRERESSRPYKTDIFEEDPGEADKVASDIQKAMNKHKKDDAKMHQLKQARTAMNKGDLDKAKKIAARLAEKLKSN